MGCSLIPLASPQPHHLHLHPKPNPKSPLSIPTNPFQTLTLKKKRGHLAVANAGPPSSTTLILAFVFPFSLFAGTVFASLRIADNLEEKFLEDLAMNRALMEENEEEDEEGGEARILEEEVVAAAEAAAAAAAAPRARSRPRREGRGEL